MPMIPAAPTTRGSGSFVRQSTRSAARKTTTVVTSTMTCVPMTAPAPTIAPAAAAVARDIDIVRAEESRDYARRSAPRWGVRAGHVEGVRSGSVADRPREIKASSGTGGGGVRLLTEPHERASLVVVINSS